MRIGSYRDTRVNFPGLDGEQLVGTLRTVREEEGRDAAAADANVAPTNPRPPIVLLAHGYMSYRDASVLVRVADALADHGVASLRWDFSGNGESGGRFRYGGYRREAGEIACAAAFCEQRQEGQGFRVIALVGHSKGATSSIVYAGGGGGIGRPRSANLRVVNVAGRFDVSEGVERRLGARVLEALRRDGRVDGMPGRRPGSAGGEPFQWTLYSEDLEDRLSTDVGKYCAAIADAAVAASATSAAPPPHHPRVRVLSLHCDNDAEVAAREAAKFHSALGGDALGHRLVVLEGGDHSFRGEAASAALVREAVAWALADQKG